MYTCFIMEEERVNFKPAEENTKKTTTTKRHMIVELHLSSVCHQL